MMCHWPILRMFIQFYPFLLYFLLAQSLRRESFVFFLDRLKVNRYFQYRASASAKRKSENDKANRTVFVSLEVLKSDTVQVQREHDKNSVGNFQLD